MQMTARRKIYCSKSTLKLKLKVLYRCPKILKLVKLNGCPTEKNLLVTRITNPNLHSEIWRVTYPNGATERISRADISVGSIRLSADGKTLLALQRIGHYNLWLANAENISPPKQISIGAAALHGVNGLAYLPDNRILYSSTQSGNLDLWAMDENGGNRRQLTVNAGTFNAEPVVTADNRFIVFVSNRSGSAEIWRMDIDGRNPFQLTQNIKETYFQVSPDNFIYLVEYPPYAPERRIYKISVENGERSQVNKDIYSTFPTISLDGKWALRPNEDDIKKFDLINAVTGKFRRTIAVEISEFVWQPDSQAIINKDRLGEKLVRIPIDGSKPQIIAVFCSI